jgi:hypothetical protein
VVETVLEKVDDFLVGNIDYSGTLVEKAPHVTCARSRPFPASPWPGPCEYPSVPWRKLLNRVLLERLEPCKWSLVQTEREVETLRVVVATSILDGEGVASEPLY